jgi:hypothetical protein
MESFEELRDEAYSVENERLWSLHSTRFETAMQKHAADAAAFQLTTDRFDPFIVEVVITRRGCLTRIDAMPLCAELKSYLLTQPEGWVFRISLCDLEDASSQLVIWLEIDRYRVNEYLGKVTSELFTTMDEFEANYL